MSHPNKARELIANSLQQQSGCTDRVVQVFARNEYGSIRYHPVNVTAGKLLRLAGQKTFTADNLSLLVDVGFCVQRVPFLAEMLSHNDTRFRATVNGKWLADGTWSTDPKQK